MAVVGTSGSGTQVSPATEGRQLSAHSACPLTRLSTPGCGAGGSVTFYGLADIVTPSPAGLPSFPCGTLVPGSCARLAGGKAGPVCSCPLRLSAPFPPDIKETAPRGWPQFAVQPRSLQWPRDSGPPAAFFPRTRARPRNRGQPLHQAPTDWATCTTLFCQFSGRFANVLDPPAQKGASLC
jgi:hypothetical protein